MLHNIMRKIISIAVPKKKAKPAKQEEEEVVEVIDTPVEDTATEEVIEETTDTVIVEETPVEVPVEIPEPTPIVGKPEGYVVVNGEVVPDHTIHSPGVNSKDF